MNLLSIYTGYALDLIIGDPYSFPHPVRYIGKLISMVEKQIRKITSSDKGLKIAGFFLWFIVVGVTFCVTSLILQLFKFNKIIYFVVNTILIYTTLATKCLKDESVKIQVTVKALKTSQIKRKDPSGYQRMVPGWIFFRLYRKNCSFRRKTNRGSLHGLRR